MGTNNDLNRVAQLIHQQQQLPANNVINLQQLTPPQFPPNFSVDDLLPSSIHKFRKPMKFNGNKAYRSSCMKNSGIVPQNEMQRNKYFRMADQLWELEPRNVRDFYIGLAHNAEHMYNGRFPEMKCKGCD